MPKTLTQYVCQQCGRISARPMGKCPQCGAWGSMVEEVISASASAAPQAAGTRDNIARIGLTDEMLLQRCIALIAEQCLHVGREDRRLYEYHELLYTNGV